ncbi:uncharacterized protein ASPGLDRAFT_43529 [Aspergillus glaucus CBS 516.65]|uniref:Uncharacterized protein n=1 Tax=Aspergillus glaucus CBS 516.65 TaxID=1160497 RepID=A0A1L9VT11_ASPGL|nr:hypothetical protein ASPGLDRAFT_43529 [Aspergillus glaucus CBS 516.65]OJJ87053.1 hypothetical protein ASPGLDRAFT_43529 [Aspergillus glaucus CBS 516.65]
MFDCLKLAPAMLLPTCFVYPCVLFSHRMAFSICLWMFRLYTAIVRRSGSVE